MRMLEKRGGLFYAKGALRMETTEEVGDGHALFACQLELGEREIAVGERNLEIGFAVGEHGARFFADLHLFALGGIEFECGTLTAFVHKFCPSSGVGRETTHEVEGTFDRDVEREATSVFEDLGGVPNFAVGRERVLIDGANVACDDVVDGTCHHTGSYVAEAIVEGFYIVGLGDGNAGLVMMRPVSISWSSRKVVTPVSVSPLIMAQLMGAAPRYCGSNEAWRIESAVEGHVPKTSGSMRKATITWRSARLAAQGVQKIGVLQLFRLEHGEVVRKGVLFYGTLREFALMSPHGLVGHGDTATTLYPPSTRARRLPTAKVGGAQ